MANGNGNGRDRVFLWILFIFSAIMVLFGAATLTLAIVLEPSDSVTLRIIAAIGSMFSGLLGLTVGYLTGRK